MHCDFVVPGEEKSDLSRYARYTIAKYPEFAQELAFIMGRCIEISKVGPGCICFKVQSKTLSALKALCERYESGSLRKSLQELLVTNEIKRMAEGKEVELKVNFDQDSYRNSYFDLFIAEKEGRLD